MSFVVRALTINIWNRQGPWPQRLQLLREGLVRLSPDVVGLQEVIHGEGDSQIDELCEGLELNAAFGPARQREDGSFYGNALLSRFPLIDSSVFPLPCLGVDEPRSVLLATFETPSGPLPVLTTHYSWRFDHGFVREQQSLAVAKVLDDVVSRIDRALPAIFMGDLNASPDAAEIRFLLGRQSLEGRSTYLADCFEETGAGQGYTFDGRHNPFAAPWHERPRRIDYVLVRGPDLTGTGKPLAAEVVFDQVTDGVAASDHYGVLATIRMSPP